jgi:hypothetical protein
MDHHAQAVQIRQQRFLAPCGTREATSSRDPLVSCLLLALVACTVTHLTPPLELIPIGPLRHPRRSDAPCKQGVRRRLTMPIPNPGADDATCRLPA